MACLKPGTVCALAQLANRVSIKIVNKMLPLKKRQETPFFDKPGLFSYGIFHVGLF
jgi:hypothetical protein